MIAQARGLRDALAHKDETVALMADPGKVDRMAVDWVHGWYVQQRPMNPNGNVSRENPKWMQELNVGLGRQARVLPLEEMATDVFQKDVVAAVGEYHW